MTEQLSIQMNQCEQDCKFWTLRRPKGRAGVHDCLHIASGVKRRIHTRMKGM